MLNTVQMVVAVIDMNQVVGIVAVLQQVDIQVNDVNFHLRKDVHHRVVDFDLQHHHAMSIVSRQDHHQVHVVHTAVD